MPRTKKSVMEPVLRIDELNKELEMPVTNEVTKNEVTKIEEPAIDSRIPIGKDAYLTLDNPDFAVLIECKAPERQRAAQDAYAYLENMAEPGQPVIIKNNNCGVSILVKTIDAFPVNTYRCGCSNPKHALVRFKFI